MPRRLLKRSQRLLVWLGVLPVVLAMTAYFTSARHLESVRTTEQADAFLRQVDALLTAITEAESGQRGYLLTGSQQYLSPYRRGKTAVQERLSQVIQTARLQGIAPEELQRLQSIVRQKMDELDHTVAFYAGGDRQRAMQVVETDRGELYMKDLRRLISHIQSGQEVLRRRASAEQHRRQEVLEGVLLLGMLLGAVLAFMAYRLNLHYALQRDEIEEHIRHLVIERTAELEARRRELESRTAELQRSNADLTQFTYVASHDLQEPLRTVASYVGLLARRYSGQLDETAQTYIRYAVDGAARMQTLINDLLVYARAGTQELELGRVPLQRIVETALDNLAATVRETGAVVRREELPAAMVDERKLGQVFQNLIANAIKFRKPSVTPEILIGARAGKGEWIVSVEDNGIGFDEKYTDRIFEVFQRLHGTGQFQGNGIGLAICRRVIEHHGGKLWATSEPGVGSMFFFTLPEADESAVRDFTG